MPCSNRVTDVGAVDGNAGNDEDFEAQGVRVYRVADQGIVTRTIRNCGSICKECTKCCKSKDCLNVSFGACCCSAYIALLIVSYIMCSETGDTGW